MPLDEYTSKNKRIQDNTYNAENTSAVVNESNEKCTLQFNKDLKITDISHARSSAVSEQHTKLENDNLSINSHTQTSNIRNAELTIHNEENLKETTSDSIEITSTSSCELNKLDNIDSNNPIDSTNVKICNSEKLSTTATVSNSNDENLEDKKVDKNIKNDNHSLKCSQLELNNDSDYVDLVKSGNSNDSLSHKDTISHKNKNKNSELVDITENENALNILKITDKVTNTSLIQNQNNSPNVKDNTEVTNKDHDINKPVMQTVNNMSVLQSILLATSDVDDSNNENRTKIIDTVIPRRKRIKKINTVQDRVEEDKQGRTYLISKVKCGILLVSIVKD